MKVISVVLACLTLASGGAMAASDAEIEKALQELSRTTNAQLPTGNDASMTIGVAAGPGKRFTYFSVSGVPSSEWTSAMRAHSYQIAVNSYCTDPGMLPFRDYGVTVAWSSSDKMGRHIYTNAVSPRDCQQ